MSLYHQSDARLTVICAALYMSELAYGVDFTFGDETCAEDGSFISRCLDLSGRTLFARIIGRVHQVKLVKDGNVQGRLMCTRDSGSYCARCNRRHRGTDSFIGALKELPSGPVFAPHLIAGLVVLSFIWIDHFARLFKSTYAKFNTIYSRDLLDTLEPALAHDTPAIGSLFDCVVKLSIIDYPRGGRYSYRENPELRQRP
ncbi:hypothetical protein B0H16DRAFT_1471547 [Mycena metata]|uniref:Uncharacterized protein n=1 Tax=Mycena metata TaxID=1033252 RepID=A0AAD7HQV2_9AGAR|nr:hypothetical protein B0H16DRAFT_1471547 [Mycena metata]